MAVIKQRLLRKSTSGAYDTIRLETGSDVVLRPDGTTVENSLTSIQTTLNNLSNPGTSGGNGSISGNINTVGSTITFDNMQWIVVDNGTYNSNERIILLKTPYCNMHSSEEYKFCDYFWNYVLSPAARAKCTPHQYTTHGERGYTIPVFVMAMEEAKGGFSYLSSDAARSCGSEYWLSTPCLSYYFYFTFIDASGTGQYGNENAHTAITLRGFRPCVSLKK